MNAAANMTDHIAANARERILARLRASHIPEAPPPARCQGLV